MNSFDLIDLIDLICCQNIFLVMLLALIFFKVVGPNDLKLGILLMMLIIGYFK